MDISQALKYLCDASDEELDRYDNVEILLIVARRLAKALSKCHTFVPTPHSDSLQHSSLISSTGGRVPEVLQSTDNSNLVKNNLISPQSTYHDIAINLSGTHNLVPLYQNPQDTGPFEERLGKAIEKDVSWLWGLRSKDMSSIISENRGDHPDARINDIARVEGKKPTNEENLIVCTAQRSLALQFEEYERENSLETTRVKDIHTALHSQLTAKEKTSLFYPGRGGLVRDFVKERICAESHRDFDLVVKSTSAGIKQRSLEFELAYRF